jgi:hypothetical protein
MEFSAETVYDALPVAVYESGRTPAGWRWVLVGLFKDSIVRIEFAKKPPPSDQLYQLTTPERLVDEFVGIKRRVIPVASIASAVVDEAYPYETWVQLNLIDGTKIVCPVPTSRTPFVVNCLQVLLEKRVLLDSVSFTATFDQYSQRLIFKAAILAGMFVAVISSAPVDTILSRLHLSDHVAGPLGATIAGAIGLALPFLTALRIRRFSRRRRNDVVARQPRSTQVEEAAIPMGPLRAPIVGAILRILGGLLALAVAPLVFTAFAVNTDIFTRVMWAITQGAFVLMPSAYLLEWGSRLSIPSAAKELTNDTRAPVVYLRPFSLDNKTSLNSSAWTSQLLGVAPFGPVVRFGPMANGHPLRLIRLALSCGADTTEEQLAVFARTIGPFVAVGRPGRLLSEEGPSMVYVADDEWKSAVARYWASAKVVVVQPGQSASMFWELSQATKHALRRKVLFCLAEFKADPNAYRDFRAQLSGLLSTEVPEERGDSLFLYLAGGTRATLLATKWKSPLKWPLHGCSVDLGETLRPFLDGLDAAADVVVAGETEGHSAPPLGPMVLALFLWSLVTLVILAIDTVAVLALLRR